MSGSVNVGIVVGRWVKKDQKMENFSNVGVRLGGSGLGRLRFTGMKYFSVYMVYILIGI